MMKRGEFTSFTFAVNLFGDICRRDIFLRNTRGGCILARESWRSLSSGRAGFKGWL